MNKPSENEFERASGESQKGIVRELIQFLGQNKKFWLIPLLLVFLALSLLIILGGTAAAPFIYAFF